jgi:hypothetical protein
VGAAGVLNIIGGSNDPGSGTINGVVNVSPKNGNPGTLTYTNTLTLESTGEINVFGGTSYINIGTITGDGGDLNVGTDGNFVLSDGATGDLGPVITSSPAPGITFTDATGTLTIKDAAVLGTMEITSFYAGDVVSLPNLVFAGTTIVSAGTVELLSAGGAIVGDVLYGGTASGATLEGSIVGAPCFAAGTRIATTRGEVPVESLRAGDEVRLARGGTAPVLWLGHRTVACSRHPRPWDVLPVRVVAHAFGPGQPRGDVLLSPDHAVFIDGVLVPIRYLLNDATIVQETVPRVTYWHVELDHHDVLLAEGLACESYLDTGNRGAFANGGGVTMMHPDFALHVWKAESCARLVCNGAELQAARSFLLERAEMLGHTLTTEPTLRLRVDGNLLIPHVRGQTYRFRLPFNAKNIRLVSRSAVPAHVRDDSDDCRQLGVAVSRIVLDGEPIALADARLGAGWHATEPGGAGGTWRWTNGDAVLTIPGGHDLEAEVAITARYWLDGDRTAKSPGVRRASASY